MPGDFVGVGVVGYGRVGEGQHAEFASKLDDMKLVAVCDPAEGRRQAAQQKHGCRTYADLDEFLSDPELDLVAICTPPSMHCEQAIAAAQAGKHCIVDKPFALSYEQAKQMIAAARESGVVITGFQNRRWDSDYLTVKKAIDDGLLGDVYHRESRWSHFTANWACYGVEEFNPTWRVQRKFGGGMVYDYASHLGDQMLRMVSAPLESVWADLQSRIWSNEVDDHFRAELRFADGTTALLEATNNVRHSLPRWFVIGTEGTLVSQPVGGCEVRVFTDSGEQLLEPVSAPRTIIYENVRDVILGRQSELLVKPEHLLETMRLISMIFRSAETGEVVHAADMG